MGFSDLAKLRERLEAIPTLLPTLIGDCVVEYREEIADLNREQLEKGETPDATPIRPAYRNPDYAKLKHAKNPKPPFGTPDLINTGEYAGSIVVDAFSDGFELRATDSKTAKLAATYGRTIGLSDYSKFRLSHEALKPYLLKRLRTIL